MPIIDVYQFEKLCRSANGPFSFRWAGRKTNYKITCDNFTGHVDIRVIAVEV